MVFFSAINEDEYYIDNPNNLVIFSLNTIANYDQDILPFLDMPVGTEVERDQDTGTFYVLNED